MAPYLASEHMRARTWAEFTEACSQPQPSENQV